jgi:hypothetical protein
VEEGPLPQPGEEPLRHPPSSLHLPLPDLGRLCLIGLCDAIIATLKRRPMRLGQSDSATDRQPHHVATVGKPGPVSSTGPYPACPRPAGPGAGAGGVSESVPLQSGAGCRGWGTVQVRRGAVQCKAKRSSCRWSGPLCNSAAATRQPEHGQASLRAGWALGCRRWIRSSRADPYPIQAR